MATKEKSRPGAETGRPRVSEQGRADEISFSTTAMTGQHSGWHGKPPSLSDRRRLEGPALLDDVHAFYSRFVAFPSDHAAVAATLWVAHTHAMDAWDSTPRLAFLSPEPGSGKSRALEIAELFVPRPVMAVNVSPAYLFRKVSDQQGRPTILHDEVDTVFGPMVRRDVEETRGLLNAGHRKGAVTGRCKMVGKTVETEEIEAYCAVALAGLGNLPDTVASRAVIIRMRRRAPHQRVDAYRRREHAPEGEKLRVRLAAWAQSNSTTLRLSRPVMPPGVEDRAADVWEPLLAIADAAGGDWPRLARQAASALVRETQQAPTTLGVQLLADIRTAFGEAGQVPTSALLEALNAMEEAPWGDLRGRPLDSRVLARMLAPYGAKPYQIRIGEVTVKGYRCEDFVDAWQRYLPPSLAKYDTSETRETNGPVGPAGKANGNGSDVSGVLLVSDFGGDRETDAECRFDNGGDNGEI